MTRGLVMGRFMPPHAGHQLLVDAARRLGDDLTIALLGAADDPIARDLRLAWCRELFPFARVVACDVAAAADPAEAAAVLGRTLPAPADLLFSARPADASLASALGVELVLVDPEHAAVPASSRAIRADPWAHWPALPPPVRPHYARTICLHGPESTGKSTLAPRLAAHFATGFVPEHGRSYCEQHGLDLAMADLVAIGRTHAAITAAALRRCNRRLILDTDPLMTAAWAAMLFGRSDPWFDRFDATADFYLLLDIDLPWVDDGTRFFGDGERRRRFFDLSRAELERRGLPYAIVSGPPARRLEGALEAIATAGLG